MKVLGIASAASPIGVAVAEDGAALGTASLAGPRARSEKIPALIEGLLGQLSLSIAAVELVAVTIGPGSYSGLRGGVAAAKAIAQGRGIPLVGVSSLEVSARALPAGSGVCLSLLPAMKEIWNAALFSLGSGGLRRITPDLTLDRTALLTWLLAAEGPVWVAGASRGLADEIAASSRVAHPVLDGSGADGALAAARLGEEKFRAGQRDDPLTLAPRYSHEPAARKFAMMPR